MLRDSSENRAVALRIIDANVNRCAEGMRVIEEIVRFAVGEEDLTRSVKELRHRIRELAGLFCDDATRFRDSAGDVGSRFSTPSEEKRESVSSAARANLFRVEEGLRVIEEFGKMIDPSGARRAKELRFRVYGLEKAILSSSAPGSAMPVSPFLYSFIDRSIVPSEAVEAVTAALIEGGSGMIQYRAKDLSMSEMRRDLMAALPLAERIGIPLIVNDHPVLAAETGAAGVHLGASDADPARAREMLGPSRIIGFSLDSAADLASAPLDILDYVAVGAVFPTSTKGDAAFAGLGELAAVKAASPLPVVAIGGIDAGNADEVLGAGADGLAVISAILEGDVLKNCFTFQAIIDRKRDETAGA